MEHCERCLERYGTGWALSITFCGAAFVFVCPECAKPRETVFPHPLSPGLKAQELAAVYAAFTHPADREE